MLEAAILIFVDWLEVVSILVEACRVDAILICDRERVWLFSVSWHQRVGAGSGQILYISKLGEGEFKFSDSQTFHR